MKFWNHVWGSKSYIGICLNGNGSVAGEGSGSIAGSQDVLGEGHRDEGGEKSNLVKKNTFKIRFLGFVESLLKVSNCKKLYNMEIFISLFPLTLK